MPLRNLLAQGLQSTTAFQPGSCRCCRCCFLWTVSCALKSNGAGTQPTCCVQNVTTYLSCSPTCQMQSVMEALTVNGDGNTEVEPGGRRMLKRPGRANVLKRYLQRGLGEEAQKIFLSMVAFRCGTCEGVEMAGSRLLVMHSSLSLCWNQSVGIRGYT